jgi:hypothetical protein
LHYKLAISVKTLNGYVHAMNIVSHPVTVIRYSHKTFAKLASDVTVTKLFFLLADTSGKSTGVFVLSKLFSFEPNIN